MKKYIVVKGGAGFVGSNLIKYLLLKTKKKFTIADNNEMRFYEKGSVTDDFFGGGRKRKSVRKTRRKNRKHKKTRKYKKN